MITIQGATVLAVGSGLVGGICGFILCALFSINHERRAVRNANYAKDHWYKYAKGLALRYRGSDHLVLDDPQCLIHAGRLIDELDESARIMGEALKLEKVRREAAKKLAEMIVRIDIATSESLDLGAQFPALRTEADYVLSLYEPKAKAVAS